MGTNLYLWGVGVYEDGVFRMRFADGSRAEAIRDHLGGRHVVVGIIIADDGWKLRLRRDTWWRRLWWRLRRWP